VIERFGSRARRSDKDFELFFDRTLSDEICQPLRTDRPIDRLVLSAALGAH
jgi:hypothetical protein